MFPKGKFRARAKSWDLGTASTGTEQVAVEFGVTEGDLKGSRITWHGYFTEATEDRTIEALRICGWTGDDLSDLRGLDAHEVEIVVDHEVYEGKTRAKVQWVNRAGGLALKSRMDDASKKDFAARMKARIAAHDKLAGTRPLTHSPSTVAEQEKKPAGDVPF